VGYTSRGSRSGGVTDQPHAVKPRDGTSGAGEGRSWLRDEGRWRHLERHVPERVPQLLLVDGDARLVTLLEERFQRDGFSVASASRGSQAIAMVDQAWPDLVILELALPDMRGEQVARQIKKRADLPVVVLSALGDAAVRTAAIRDFAEDFIVKPFHYPELHARVQRILRRAADRVLAEEHAAATGLVLALRRREAIRDGVRIRLTPVESRFLGALTAMQGQPLSTEQLLARVWPGADTVDPVYVWVTVRRLRKKLEPDPANPLYLHTVRGGGYRLGDPT